MHTSHLAADLDTHIHTSSSSRSWEFNQPPALASRPPTQREAGLAGCVLSNHGGRQLDTCRPGIEAERGRRADERGLGSLGGQMGGTGGCP